MVLDHTLAFVETTQYSAGWMNIARLTVTRLSLPAFMACTGYLLADHIPSRRRRLEIAGVALAVNAIIVAANTGLAWPEILGVWTLVMIFAGAIRRWPTTIAILGLIQYAYWPLPHFDDYQPGWVAAFIALGVLLARSGAREFIDSVGRRLPLWVQHFGRHPLVYYVAHLAIIAALAEIGWSLGWW